MDRASARALPTAVCRRPFEWCTVTTRRARTRGSDDRAPRLATARLRRSRRPPGRRASGRPAVPIRRARRRALAASSMHRARSASRPGNTRSRRGSSRRRARPPARTGGCTPLPTGSRCSPGRRAGAASRSRPSTPRSASAAYPAAAAGGPTEWGPTSRQRAGGGDRGESRRCAADGDQCFGSIGARSQHDGDEVTAEPALRRQQHCLG